MAVKQVSESQLQTIYSSFERAINRKDNWDSCGNLKLNLVESDMLIDLENEFNDDTIIYYMKQLALRSMQLKVV
jgi:hypothetical protein